MTISSNPHDTGDLSGGWKLTGWHVLACLTVFFGVMIAANGVFLYYALTTFTGIETADAYRKGVAYNERLEDARQLDKLGWQGSLKAANGGIEFTLNSSDGKPLRGIRVTGKVGRPATDAFDQTIAFEDAGAGRYLSEPVTLAPGNWIVTVEAHDANANDLPRRYQMKERLWLSQ